MPFECVDLSDTALHTRRSFQKEIDKSGGYVTFVGDWVPPEYFVYVNDFVFRCDKPVSRKTGCVCKDRCLVGKCLCAKRVYRANGTLTQAPYWITECGDHCSCTNCYSRVAQKGLQVHVELRYTPKGWGAFANQNIPNGTFVAEYLGELLTQKLCLGRDTSYMLDMDFYSDKIENECMLTIDAKKYGNVSRFFNHSCDGNLSNFPVFYDVDKSDVFVRVAMYANRDILEGEELTFDYEGRGLKGPMVGGKCLCESINCRKIIKSLS